MWPFAAAHFATSTPSIPRCNRTTPHQTPLTATNQNWGKHSKTTPKQRRFALAQPTNHAPAFTPAKIIPAKINLSPIDCHHPDLCARYAPASIRSHRHHHSRHQHHALPTIPPASFAPTSTTYPQLLRDRFPAQQPFQPLTRLARPAQTLGRGCDQYCRHSPALPPCEPPAIAASNPVSNHPWHGARRSCS